MIVGPSMAFSYFPHDVDTELLDKCKTAHTSDTKCRPKRLLAAILALHVPQRVGARAAIRWISTDWCRVALSHTAAPRTQQRQQPGHKAQTGTRKGPQNTAERRATKRPEAIKTKTEQSMKWINIMITCSIKGKRSFSLLSTIVLIIVSKEKFPECCV